MLAPLLLASALAQTDPIPERLYVGSGLVIGSNRMVGLSGGYAGIAEGADGASSNVASLAHRDPRREGQWDWDVSFSGLFGVSPLTRDVDNDGRKDDADSSSEYNFAGLIQFGRAGIGFYTRGNSVTYCLEADCAGPDQITVTRYLSGLGIGVSVWRDQIVVGVGAIYSNANFQLGDEKRTYQGPALEAGVLYRPLQKNFRFGASVKQETLGGLVSGGEDAVLAGRPLYSGIVSPWTLSIGGSFRIGPGSERYNRLSKSALFEIHYGRDEKPIEPDNDYVNPPGRTLVSIQADVIFPVKNATSLDAFRRGEAATRIGNAVYLAPRFGVEHETFVHRLRLRGGGYLEPSPFPQRDARVHATFGFELFLFHLIDDWTISSAMDLSTRYYNIGFGIGFWR
jgi:hypothetical protein